MLLGSIGRLFRCPMLAGRAKLLQRRGGFPSPSTQEELLEPRCGRWGWKGRQSRQGACGTGSDYKREASGYFLQGTDSQTGPEAANYGSLGKQDWKEGHAFPPQAGCGLVFRLLWFAFSTLNSYLVINCRVCTV